MTLTPFINAPLIIQVHALCALTALILGPFAIHRARRDQIHKYIGYVWVSAMFVAAGSALAIPSFTTPILFHWGPIHALAFFALFSLWRGMAAIYRGDIVQHRAALRGLYWQGLAIAGLLNLLPGRVSNRVLFPDTPEVGYIVIALGGIGLAMIAWHQRHKNTAAA